MLEDGIQFRDNTSSALKVFPVFYHDSILASAGEAEETLSDPMPSVDDVFTEKFIKDLLFPVALILDTAKFFGLGKLEDSAVDDMALREAEKENKSLLTLIQSLAVLECSPDTVKAFLDIYR